MTDEERAKRVAEIDEGWGNIPDVRWLRSELARFTAERDAWRNKAMDAAKHPVVVAYMSERDAALAQVAQLREALDAIVNKDWWVPLNGRDELDKGRAALAATTPIETIETIGTIENPIDATEPKP